MKNLLANSSGRFGYDGWALKIVDGDYLCKWSVCTTRAEAREVRDEFYETHPDLFTRFRVVKVRIDAKEIT